MLPFQISLLVFLRITALSLASPVLLADVSSVEQSPSISSLSPNDDSIPSSSTTDLILSSKNNLASNPNDITPGLLTTAGDSSSWVDITSSPQQQQQQPQPIAFCGGAPNRKRAKVGQLAQLNGVGGETKVCDASLDYTAPSKDGGSTTQKEPTGQQTDTTGRKKKGSGEFYKGGGPRPGPTQIFPSDQDVELQNGMQAAKNRQLELDDPARCNYAPFFVRICCNGELGPRIFDSFRGFHYQFVGFCVLREFFSLFLLLRFPIPLPPPPPACPCLWKVNNFSLTFHEKTSAVNPTDFCTLRRDLCCEYFRVSCSSLKSRYSPQSNIPKKQKLSEKVWCHCRNKAKQIADAKFDF